MLTSSACFLEKARLLSNQQSAAILAIMPSSRFGSDRAMASSLPGTQLALEGVPIVCVVRRC